MLPILTFVAGQLSPSYGYFFDRRWLMPQESIVSIAWKFARMNALPGHIVARQFARHQVDPYEGVAATVDEVAVTALARALAIPRRALSESVEPGDGTRLMHPLLRFCHKCMRFGYHGVMHQRAEASHCPCHGLALEEHCRGCAASIPYRLNARLLNAPMRCATCRRPYSASSRDFVPRPLPFDLRKAIARWRCQAGPACREGPFHGLRAVDRFPSALRPTKSIDDFSSQPATSRANPCSTPTRDQAKT